jgi:lipid A disaccharide synthetase
MRTLLKLKMKLTKLQNLMIKKVVTKKYNRMKTEKSDLQRHLHREKRSKMKDKSQQKRKKNQRRKVLKRRHQLRTKSLRK